MFRFSLLSSVLALSLAGCADRALTLRRVVLYQNGIGYFERSGNFDGDQYRLRLRSHEVGDVLKSMVVIDQLGQRQRAVSAAIPMADGRNGRRSDDDHTHLDLLLGQRGHHALTIAYAAPTPVWKPSYRVVLPDAQAPGGLLQAWAIVHNASGEPWQRVELVLATGAPLSFAMDLQRAEFAARPDLNGRLVRPVATGIVQAEQTQVAELDQRATVDTDRDHIPDAQDKCPNEPETYNGIEDEDGCPDRGRVIVTSSKIEILDKVYFERDGSNIKPVGFPILDAVAATLTGNPQITLIELQGHACASEPRALEVAQKRAANVQLYLVAHGVERHRLEVRGYGATRPISSAANEEGCARNRRVEFVIKQRRDADGDSRADNRPGPPAVTAQAVRQSAGASATPIDVAGATFYTVSDRVTLPQGAATMVSMLTLTGGAEDIFLFRPDGNVTGSARHPLRAARLRIGVALEPGPVAVFARGRFVGEGVLGRLHPGETALLPYALDSSTRVQLEQSESQQPLRLVSIRNGTATVEDEAQRTSQYDISTGADAPARIFLRHARRADYKPQNLPAETEEGLDAYLLPHALQPSSRSQLSLVETRQLRRTLPLRSQAESVCEYLPKSSPPPAVQTSLRAICQLQKDMMANQGASSQLRARLDTLRERADELRSNLQAIEKIATAGALRNELLTKLRENEQHSGELQKQLVARNETQATQDARLTQLVAELQFDSDAPPAAR
jgi:outer membrane protein OmpA-like peptidoglycan-associated protein